MIDDQPVTPAPKTNEDAADQTHNPQGTQLPIARPVVQPHPAKTNREITCNIKRDGWDKAKMVAELIGILVLILYTIYTAGIYCANKKAAEAAHDTLGEIQKQTILMRQQLVGSQGAIVKAYPEVSNDGEVSIRLNNLGVVTTTDIRLSIKATRKKIADDSALEPPTAFEIAADPLKGGGTEFYKRQLPWQLHELTDKSEWPKQWPGNETTELFLHVTYQDGFGNNMPPIDVCRKWFPHYNVTTKTGGSGGGGFVGCEDFKNAIAEAIERERKAEQEQKN